MKNKLMLVAAMVVTLSANAQSIVGPKTIDSLNFWTSGLTRMYITHDGKVSVNNGNLATPIPSTMTIRSMGGHMGLSISDNYAFTPPQTTQLLVTTYERYWGTWVQGAIKNGAAISQPQAGCYNAVGSNVGYARRNYGNLGAPIGTTYGFVSGNNPENESTCNFVSFISSGAINTGSTSSGTTKDFWASGWYGTPKPTGTRYALYIDYPKDNLTNAWGIYQSNSTVSNHMNGTTLLGTTTDNTFDKVQVTGGTQTDGFAAGIVTKDNSTLPYTAVNTDYTILVNAASGTITLPTSASASNVAAGKIFVIKKTSSSPGTITVQPDNSSGTHNIDGNSSTSISLQYESIMVQYDGNDYFILASH